MSYNIMRYPVSGTRADAEVFDEGLECSQEDLHALVVALRKSYEGKWWYWYEQNGARPLETAGTASW